MPERQNEGDPMKLSLTIIQLEDLLHLAKVKRSRVSKTGDRPYWDAIVRKLEDALRHERETAAGVAAFRRSAAP